MDIGRLHRSPRFHPGRWQLYRLAWDSEGSPWLPSCPQLSRQLYAFWMPLYFLALHPSLEAFWGRQSIGISNFHYNSKARIPTLRVMLVWTGYACHSGWKHSGCQTQVNSRFCLIPQLLELSLSSHMIKEIAACCRTQSLISLPILAHPMHVSKKCSECCSIPAFA